MRFLAHVADGLRQAIDTRNVIYIAADADETEIRLENGSAVRDVRSIAETEKIVRSADDFLRIHRSYIINLAHLHQVRRRDQGRDWECVLSRDDGPVIPISRDRYPELMGRFRS